jgi:hypothetical protein
VAELIPWRGSLADNAGDHARSLAARLRSDGRMDAVSITDRAGGHATLSPEVIASDLLGQGDQVFVHVACRDRNRNELLSLGWRLASAGIENVLTITGDYPREGLFGLARPVFDIDSVGLLKLCSAVNSGAIARDVVSRRVPRDRVRDFPRSPWRAGAPRPRPRTSISGPWSIPTSESSATCSRSTVRQHDIADSTLVSADGARLLTGLTLGALWRGDHPASRGSELRGVRADRSAP